VHDGDRDVLADEPPQHRHDPVEDAGEVDERRIRRSLTREGEELPGELGGPAGGAVDLLELGGGPLGLGAQQRRVARDDREQVVEVVRDAAGEAPDRLHATRLLELLLEAALLGDVADDERGRVDASVRVADREAGDRRRERRAVAAATALRLVLERVARGDPAHQLGVPALPPLLDEHVPPRPADRRLVGPAERPRRGWVPGDDRAVEPEADDRVAGGVDDGREPALLLLRLALLGDVARDRRDPGDLALVVLDRADRVREDEPPARAVESRGLVGERLARSRAAHDLCPPGAL
jgi:hypothetical protein